MSRQTTWTCDQCDASMTIDHHCEVLPAGWIEIAFGFNDEHDDEDEPPGDVVQFCSWPCAAKFCGEQARSTGPTRTSKSSLN